MKTNYLNGIDGRENVQNTVIWLKKGKLLFLSIYQNFE